MTDLERAFEFLNGKQENHTALWNYYDGDHPLLYSTKRLREIFKKIDVTFSENWCAVVVDSTLERVQLEGLSGPNKGITERLTRIFKETQLDIDADDVHKAAFVTGEGFVFCWKRDDGTKEAFYNDPRLCTIQYDPSNPKRKLWGAKWWVREDGRVSLNLYYPERIEYYVSDKKEPNRAGNFTMEKQAENPFGEVPMFHFRREQRKIKSELKSVISIQAAINKLASDMMVASEFGAYRQRYVISDAENISELKNSPNEIWDLPKESKVGEFDATQLSNYVSPIDHFVGAISAISRTPRHYFFREGSAPSGEALIAMEAPLNKKCERYIRLFENTWQEVGTFLLKLDGVEVDREDIGVAFAKPETVQPKTQAEITEIDVRTGIPLETSLRKRGESEAELEMMRKDQAAAAKQRNVTLAQALLDAQKNFDQENVSG